MNHPSIELLLPVLFLILLFLFFGWFLKKVKQKQYGDTKSVRIHSSISVGPNQRIILIESMDEWLLVGASGQQINTLLHFDHQTKNKCLNENKHFPHPNENV